jgi:hypothetical protein
VPTEAAQQIGAGGVEGVVTGQVRTLDEDLRPAGLSSPSAISAWSHVD